MSTPENMIGPDEHGNVTGTLVKLPPPSIDVKSGLNTSSGQFTAIFALAALFLSFLGFHYSASQIEGWVGLVEHFLETLGPILAIVPVLMTYINSRGKIASNAINATADVMKDANKGPLGTPALAPVSLIGAPDPDGLSKFIGGESWKDPERYENLLNIAGQFGVPGAAQADKINQQIHPAQLIKGILGMIHKKKS